uniref:Cytochrome c oxidase assembly factor COX18 n=1 Tax=Leptobrachium leishanense TaxID=445787 RepID=A0A8C5LND9_9ANUR
MVMSWHVACWAPWIRSFSVNSCQKPLRLQYLHARGCTAPYLKSHSLILLEKNPLTSALQRSHAYSTRTLFKPGPSVLYPYRTIAFSFSLSASSSKDANSGYSLYESLADSAPVHLAENVLITLQEASGLPWWANIICTTIALRTAVTLPLSVYQMHIFAKVENLQPEIEQLAQRLRYEVSVYGKQKGWNDKTAKFYFRKNLKRIISELYVRDNCHPVKASLLIWIQIPMWIFVSVALRNISFATASGTGEALQRQLSNGGALWFPDLTIPDSTWILPVSLGITNLLILEIFALRKIKRSKFQKVLTNVMRVVCVFMVPIAASVPSSLALYWFSSSCVGLAQNLILRSPAFRRICRIPRHVCTSDIRVLA